jgi:dTDP-glucose 4,6-dehydratase
MINVLVTGGAGFIGSNYIRKTLSDYPNLNIVNLDLLTYAGNLENLKNINYYSRYTFIKGDIRDRDLLNSLFEKYSFDFVINFAAESHVDRSIANSEVFLTTNILGTHNLLETAKNHWKKNIQDKKSYVFKDKVKFLQVSTDEVYGDLGSDGLFSESHNLNPNSPYSASKASADLIVRSFFKTYGLPINITRCSNNYGPYQFPEKLIPLIINNCMNNRSLPVYGDGLQVRDWLHVNDHVDAINTVLFKGEIGEVYNIGGNNEWTNIDIIRLIIKNLGKSFDLINYVNDRLGHDRRYAIDNTKISSKLGWKPKYTFQQGIDETIIWYKNNQNWIKNVTTGGYQDYYKRMYE